MFLRDYAAMNCKHLSVKVHNTQNGALPIPVLAHLYTYKKVNNIFLIF
jgi:hypothetical protein